MHLCIFIGEKQSMTIIHITAHPSHEGLQPLDWRGRTSHWCWTSTSPLLGDSRLTPTHSFAPEDSGGVVGDAAGTRRGFPLYLLSVVVVAAEGGEAGAGVEEGGAGGEAVEPAVGRTEASTTEDIGRKAGEGVGEAEIVGEAFVLCWVK